MLTGLLVVAPVALAQGKPEAPRRRRARLARDRRHGQHRRPAAHLHRRSGSAKVGVVAPISSAEGAVAALIAVAAGETLGDRARHSRSARSPSGSFSPRGRPRARPGGSTTYDPRAALFGVAAALAFGTGLYATGRASLDLPIAWAVLPPRLLGVAFVTIPLLVLGRLRLTRAALPYVVGSGLAEVDRLRLATRSAPAMGSRSPPSSPRSSPRSRRSAPRSSSTSGWAGRRHRRGRDRRRRRRRQCAQRLGPRTSRARPGAGPRTRTSGRGERDRRPDEPDAHLRPDETATEESDAPPAISRAAAIPCVSGSSRPIWASQLGQRGERDVHPADSHIR